MVDQLYFVHASTDISVDLQPMYKDDILTDTQQICQSTYRPTLGKNIDQDVLVNISTNISVEHRSTDMLSIGRYVDRHLADMLVDMSTESGCLIVDRHVDR